MSMPSFREALSKAQAHHNPAAARAVAPAAAPSFLSDLAERVEASPEVVVSEQIQPTPPTARVVPFQPSRAPIEPATSTGFNSMLQRIAGSTGAKVVSVLGEAAPTAPVQAPVAAPAATAQIDEGLGSLLNKIANPIGAKEVGEGILANHHNEVHDHLEAAHASIKKAHEAIGRAHELATDPVHKQHLEQQSLAVATLHQGITNAKAGNNFSIQHYMGQARRG